MFDPVATYRLQFNKDFTLSHLEKLIPYLKKLGMSTIYASPLFAATPGSMHGYDSIDPHSINPEIGTEEQFKALTKRLKEEGMAWLQDIVPNHMAFHPGNKWLMDVLEKGKKSQYASFFDVDWNSDVFGGKIMVPFLGATLDEVIDGGELKITSKHHRLGFSYYDSFYPLQPQSYEIILRAGSTEPEVLTSLTKLNDGDGDLLKQWDKLREEIFADPAFVMECVNIVNSDTDRLKAIAAEQHYALCYWKETDTQINFRRFFTINGLICLNIQDENVFEHFHQKIKAFVDEGFIQGLRIDHIDGLYDPEEYLEDIRMLTGDDAYIVVEKILQVDEGLPGNWAVQGNTGYDFLAMVNNLFTNCKTEKIFTKFYEELTGNYDSIPRQLREKKAHILYEHMGGELENLLNLFDELELVHDWHEQVSREDMKHALGEFLIECPVYRYYGNKMPLNKEESKAIRHIIDKIKKHNSELTTAADLLETALIKNPKEGTEEYRSKALHFYKRFMQFPSPLMAKGMEDTLMYTYNRFIGHNEVGDTLDVFGITVDEFHDKMIERQEKWPLSINATSTHDTKRGEDMRARLNVLTDIADEWVKTVKEWRKLNAGLKVNGMPDDNDEYLIYQTLIGAHPMNISDDDDLAGRLEGYIRKALREAKNHSDWSNPNEEYENAAILFGRTLLNRDRPFWTSFAKFHQRIVDAGIINSLSQVLLKFTCPGVPDIYQGTALWDLSLVDPDNRRDVDFPRRINLFSELQRSEGYDALLHELWQTRYYGKIKLWLIHVLLKERKQHADLFAKGEYIPLPVKGKLKDHIIAFARRYKHTWYVVATPLNLASINKRTAEGNIDWKDTRIVLPDYVPIQMEHRLYGIKEKAAKELMINDLFKQLPLALIKMEQPGTMRGAGVLLSVTSLPSHFGVGDFGVGARNFAKFLCRSHQKYWQMLPLNPTDSAAGYSPYSSISSMAGNTLLISPELLAEAGLLDKKELEAYYLPNKNEADYESAVSIKEELFDKAYENYASGHFPLLKKKFEAFCRKEMHWLDDFALFVLLKQQHEDKPWSEWSIQYRRRDRSVLNDFGSANSEELNKVKWLQFLFITQWNELRTYCCDLGIELVGDIPFYVSHDSADVWANPDIFCLDENGNMEHVAGVPPDYFSENGQLWGMPTFKWDVLKQTKYKWWIDRLRKNLELFDHVRLDHFRAFAEYWEVPMGETTAKNGKWIDGPGEHFFEVVKNEFGSLPFIAEDLGDNMMSVYELRDRIGLPGMKVLQFAFGDHLPDSVDIPHNYQENCIVYTGTHDNNTSLGWYQQESNRADHKRLQEYNGATIKQKDIHFVLGRMAYSSLAKTAIIPMQDILGLDSDARMNTPGTVGDNWTWRLLPDQMTEEIEAHLRKWVYLYKRI